MKYFFSFFLIVGILRAELIEVPSEISTVTVYADRARVTRSGEAQIPAGENVLRFSGLPVHLDESSVQAGGSGETAVHILGLEIREKFSMQAVNEQVRQLEQELQTLNDQDADLKAQRQDLNERRTFLNKMRDSLKVSVNPEAKSQSVGLAEVRSLYEFYSGELDDLTKRIRIVDVSLRELEPKRRVLEEELSRLRGSGQKAEKEVLVAIKADQASRLQLSLSYNMQNASWQPQYDARVSTKDGKIDLAYNAVIRQQTGEEWRNVKLSLSTARPNVGARMPELQPWWVQIAQILAKPASVPMDRDLRSRDNFLRDQVQGATDSSEPEGRMNYKAPVQMETAEIDNSGVSAVFDIKIPATIPSDGEPHKVAITTRQFDGKLEYVITPKLSEMAYLKARLTNSAGAPILGGVVNVFRDGDFVGKSQVNFIAEDADFDFFLGVDDGVKVTRKILLDKSAESGLLQKRKGVTRKYETTVENFKRQPLTITLLDQLPVVQDTSITISNVKFNEQPKSREKDTGKLTWEFFLEPKQKKVLYQEFTAEWPADKQVTGL